MAWPLWRLDGPALLFLVPVLVVAAAAALYAPAYLTMERYRGESRLRYWALYALFVAGMAVTLLAADLVLFLVGWETMTLASYVLVVHETRDPAALRAGFKYFVMTHAASAGLLLAVVLLRLWGGTFAFDRLAGTFAELAATRPLALHAVLALLFVGFATKAGLYPFGDWLPDAHPAAPAPVSAVLSGVMVKLGLYGFLRFFVLLLATAAPAAAAGWGWVLAGFGVLSGLVGGAAACVAADTKVVLAYSSIAQSGLVALGLGAALVLAPHHPALAALALLGAAFHVVADALVKALLFLTAGSLQWRTGSRRLDELGGLFEAMPVTGACALAGALAMAGLPPLTAFTGKWLMLQATVLSRVPALAVAGIGLLLASLLSVLYAARYFAAGFANRPMRRGRCEVPGTMQAAQAALAALAVAVGLAPGAVLAWLERLLAGLPALAGAQSGAWGAALGPAGGAFAPLLLVACGAWALVVVRAALGGGAPPRADEVWMGGVPAGRRRAAHPPARLLLAGARDTGAGLRGAALAQPGAAGLAAAGRGPRPLGLPPGRGGGAAPGGLAAPAAHRRARSVHRLAAGGGGRAGAAPAAAAPRGGAMSADATGRAPGGAALERVREALGAAAREVAAPRPGRLWVTVEPDAVLEAASALFGRLGARYVISVGADRRREGRGFEVLHCFALDGEHVFGALRVPAAGEPPAVPSIAGLVPGAAWAELEMQDLLGIESRGHPSPRRLVLPDDFPRGVYPLRKDVPYDFRVDGAAGGGPAGGAGEGDGFRFREPPPGSTVVQLGPFFPVLEEPSQWRLFVDGENVVGADYRGFYCHRAIEKLADSRLDYNQVVSLAERICGICGCVHSTAYCQAVEEAAGIEVPLRARLVRTVALELERLQSHLLWLGLACHIVGFDYVFMHAWRLREPVLALAERLSGSRKHFGVNLVGGTRFDVPHDRLEALRATADEVEREAGKLARAIEGDEALLSRLRGVGAFTPEEVRASGAVGPTARGSGVALDARRDQPYAAYDLLDVRVVTHGGGDVLGRTMVRVLEIFETARLLRGCAALLAETPEGGIMAPVPDTLPAGLEGLSAVEAPRGEAFHYVRTGPGRGPDRWRVRAPSYQNIQAVPLMFKPGTQVADVPITLGSVDPCFSCTERTEVVDRGRGTVRVLRRAELEALARDDMTRRRAARGGGAAGGTER